MLSPDFRINRDYTAFCFGFTFLLLSLHRQNPCRLAKVLNRDFLSAHQDPTPQYPRMALTSSGAPVQPGSPERIIS